MRDRLIELLKGAENKVAEGWTRPLALEEWLGIYADHLLANGVILPPCKVRDTIYVVDRALKKVIERKVSDIRLTDWNELFVYSYGFGYPFCLFGKTVFLTKEEAEKCLKEKENDNI